jgi:hypothetical protein
MPQPPKTSSKPHQDGQPGQGPLFEHIEKNPNCPATKR